MLDGDPALPKKGRSPQFLAHVYCGQTAARVKMPLGMEVSLDSGDFGSMGTQLHPEKGHPTPPNFGPCQLWPNGWMDQDATWYGGRPRPKPHCIRRGRGSPRKGHRLRPSRFLWHTCPVHGVRHSQRSWLNYVRPNLLAAQLISLYPIMGIKCHG